MTTAHGLPKRADIPAELTWNLATIYPTDDAWEAEFTRVAGLIPGIASYAGRLGESAAVMREAFAARDAAGESLGRLFVYAHMRLHEDSANNAYQALADRVTTLANDFSAATAYMTPEILALAPERVDTFLAGEPGLTVYRHQFDEINRERPHVLSAEMESLLAQAAELGAAPERVFEMLNNADLKLPQVHDEQGDLVQLSQGNYGAKFLESQNRAVRQEAFEAMLG
ncbi:MAG: oligoendopeptidase F, partial [Ktedonobacterales bacterium]